METEVGKKSYRQRKCQLRGNRNVQMQALMAFSAYNIKRLVKAITLNTKGAQERMASRTFSLLDSWLRLLALTPYTPRVLCF